ncbi:MAG: hypothetical protein H6739_30895 [Alphaproteobacteria bacterium]|nr:hypothetical protein [Alphaproteobacteria bacterium]
MMRLPMLFVFALACRNDKDVVNETGPVVTDDTGGEVVDADGDGFSVDEDCNDADAAINPGATEVPYDGVDNDCDAATADDDLDGDGFPLNVDCDDTDADTHPGATEVCNGEDDDCDGEIDDAAGGVWYADLDGDGYGDRFNSSQLCEGTTGFVADGSDCDDTDADVNPGAYELCEDETDNDCDGRVDEDEAYDAAVWYQDVDRDGYGDPDYTTRACDQPTGYADNDDDCDDAEATTHPGATEVCDSVDNDCDGATDEEGATGGGTYYADSDGDGYGSPDYTRQACEAPAGYVSDSSDCDDSDASSYPGAIEDCDQDDDDCDGTVDEGATTTYYLDLDGDGYGDDGYTAEACSAPTSYYVTSGGDCDDADSDYNPGATAGCDGNDYDCDGLVDNDGDGDGYSDISCGGLDCDDSDASIVPEQGGGCALGTTCLDILDSGVGTTDGVYTVDPDGLNTGVDPWDVYCDMTTEGGGWTLLGKTIKSGLSSAERDTIRRGDWQTYTQDGYGDPETTSLIFWAPLEFWYQLTRAYPNNILWLEDSGYDLRMDEFEIADSSLDYAIDWASGVSGYDQIITVVKGQGFTTYDNDNDTWSSNCSYQNVGYNGGWWYTNCYQLSMLHADNNLYSWRNNVSNSVTYLYIWFRED